MESIIDKLKEKASGKKYTQKDLIAFATYAYTSANLPDKNKEEMKLLIQDWESEK